MTMTCAGIEKTETSGGNEVSKYIVVIKVSLQNHD